MLIFYVVKIEINSLYKGSLLIVPNLLNIKLLVIGWLSKIGAIHVLKCTSDVFHNCAIYFAPCDVRTRDFLIFPSYLVFQSSLILKSDVVLHPLLLCLYVNIQIYYRTINTILKTSILGWVEVELKGKE